MHDCRHISGAALALCAISVVPTCAACVQAYLKGNTSQEMAATLKWGTDYLLKTMAVDTEGTARAGTGTKTQKFTHYFLVYQARTHSSPLC